MNLNGGKIEGLAAHKCQHFLICIIQTYDYYKLENPKPLGRHYGKNLQYFVQKFAIFFSSKEMTKYFNIGKS